MLERLQAASDVCCAQAYCLELRLNKFLRLFILHGKAKLLHQFLARRGSKPIDNAR
jgi:hypothetical protein